MFNFKHSRKEAFHWRPFNEDEIYCDTLAAYGRATSEEDQALSILAGLRSEFERTIAIITLRIESYSVTAATALLLAYENRALQHPLCQSPRCMPILQYNQHRLGIIIMILISLIGAIVDPIDQTIIAGEEKEFLRANLYVNYVEKLVQKCYHRFDISFTGVNSSQ